MTQELFNAELWAQALALEELLGGQALDWVTRQAAVLREAGDATGEKWMRSMAARLAAAALPGENNDLH